MESDDLSKRRSHLSNGKEISANVIPGGKAPPVRKGWVTKKNRKSVLFSNWRARWVVVENGILSYFTNNTGDALKGTMDLDMAEVMTYKESTSEEEYVIFIQTAKEGENDLIFKVKTAAEAEDWTQALVDHAVYMEEEMGKLRGSMTRFASTGESATKSDRADARFGVSINAATSQRRKTIVDQYATTRRHSKALVEQSLVSGRRESQQVQWIAKEIELDPIFVVKFVGHIRDDAGQESAPRKYFINVGSHDALCDPESFSRPNAMKTWLNSAPNTTGVAMPLVLMGQVYSDVDKSGAPCSIICAVVTSELGDLCNEEDDNDEAVKKIIDRLCLDLLFGVKKLHKVRSSGVIKTPKMANRFFGAARPKVTLRVPIIDDEEKWSLALTEEYIAYFQKHGELDAMGLNMLRDAPIGTQVYIPETDLTKRPSGGHTRNMSATMTPFADQLSDDIRASADSDARCSETMTRLFGRATDENVQKGMMKNVHEVPSKTRIMFNPDVTPISSFESSLQSDSSSVPPTSSVGNTPQVTVENNSSARAHNAPPPRRHSVVKEVISKAKEKRISEVKRSKHLSRNAMLMPISMRRYVPYVVVENKGVLARVAPDRTIKCTPIHIYHNTIVFAMIRQRARDRAEWLRVVEGWIIDRPHGNVIRAPSLALQLVEEPSSIKVTNAKIEPLTSDANAKKSMFSFFSKKTFDLRMYMDVVFEPVGGARPDRPYGDKICVFFISRTFTEIKTLEKDLGLPESVLKAPFPADLTGDDELLEHPDILIEFTEMVSNWLSALLQRGPSCLEEEKLKIFLTPNKDDIEQRVNPALLNGDGLDGAWRDVRFSENEDMKELSDALETVMR